MKLIIRIMNLQSEPVGERQGTSRRFVSAVASPRAFVVPALAGMFPPKGGTTNYYHWIIAFVLPITLLLTTTGCDTSPPPTEIETERTQPKQAWFREITKDCGIDFGYVSGHQKLHVFPEIMGGGVALFDMDNDGDLDVYLVQGGSLNKPQAVHTNQLFRNDGAGKFTNVSEGSGAADSGYGMGVTAGDFDNDGDIDLYVTNVGPNVMLENDGTGKFTDVTQRTGTGVGGWSTSAAFVDIERDGDLDLYICNYIAWSPENDLRCNNRAGLPDYCNPTSYNAPMPDTLYINNGDGTFKDASADAGMRSSFGNGLGVVCGDYNGDGHTDIFVANDGMNNQYWINDGTGKFTDQAMISGCAVDKNGKAKAGMGTCAADIDNDDDLDLLVVNLQAQADSFFRNEGTFFIDETPMVGLGTATRTYTRFGVGWGDFNHDGTLDLFQANGRVTMPDEVAGMDDPFAEPNILLAGEGQRFVPVADGIPNTSRTSRAAGFGDIDNDGDIDIVVVNRDAQVEVLENTIGSGNGNWLTVRVINREGNDAVGASLRATINGVKTRRDVNPYFSYLASNDHRVHFGLQKAKTVESIEVTWLDGTKSNYGPFDCNQIVELKRK
ncbi:MAG: CRTAC1 family protein [Planctomycetota bacterium]